MRRRVRPGATADLERPAAQPLGAAQYPGQLAAPRAHETADAQHLAGVDLDVDPRQPPPMQAAPDDDGLVQLVHGLRRALVLGQILADHHLDQIPGGETGDGPLPDEAPVTQDGDSVGDLQDLLEAVGDEDHRRARVPGATDGAEEAVDLVVGQRGGRLVQHEDARGVTVHVLEGPSDRDHGLVRQRQVGDVVVRGDADLEALQQQRRTATLLT